MDLCIGRRFALAATAALAVSLEPTALGQEFEAFGPNLNDVVFHRVDDLPVGASDAEADLLDAGESDLAMGRLSPARLRACENIAGPVATVSESSVMVAPVCICGGLATWRMNSSSTLDP